MARIIQHDKKFICYVLAPSGAWVVLGNKFDNAVVAVAYLEALGYTIERGIS